ncbi:hypothetical protein [Neptuniibacter marinus]|uniref:hypothetical protein n=1 Tax=Neptuniibacter marinus TaxID=1806670 RepID=UPI003B5BFB11
MYYIMKWSVLALVTVLLSGCKSSEEMLFEACVDGLENRLEKWAKYDGWRVDSPKVSLYKMVPDKEANDRWGTDQFWNFEVLISDFTVKNGFNASINSTSVCSGYVSQNSKGEYEAPDDMMLDFTLNGKKVGF